MSSDPLDELRARAREKFSDAEISNFINMGKRIASKPVLAALKVVVNEGPARGLDAAEAERLCRKIDAVSQFRDCGYVELEFRETTMKLIVCLSLVERGYRTEVDIPSTDYINDLFSKYDFLKQTAVAYWRTFVEENGKLAKRIAAYRADVDFGNLQIDGDSKTTMFWDAEAAKRVGIFCYYVDVNGKPFYKRSARRE